MRLSAVVIDSQSFQPDVPLFQELLSQQPASELYEQSALFNESVAWWLQSTPNGLPATSTPPQPPTIGRPVAGLMVQYASSCPMDDGSVFALSSSGQNQPRMLFHKDMIVSSLCVDGAHCAAAMALARDRKLAIQACPACALQHCGHDRNSR
ncbi:MAG: hypothetical protein LDL19_00550 [Thiobacillus sp.]|nr:hypothetical protein [Thiobacillus sp.]